MVQSGLGYIYLLLRCTFSLYEVSIIRWFMKLLNVITIVIWDANLVLLCEFKRIRMGFVVSRHRHTTIVGILRWWMGFKKGECRKSVHLSLGLTIPQKVSLVRIPMTIQVIQDSGNCLDKIYQTLSGFWNIMKRILVLNYCNAKSILVTKHPLYLWRATPRGTKISRFRAVWDNKVN